MSDPGSLLHVRAAGMDLLVSTLDIREVIAPSQIASIPGRPQGIRGVVIYQGEFLPVLAWDDLPGTGQSSGSPMAFVVLRPRLGLPLEKIIGLIEPPEKGWEDVVETDEAGSWLGGICHLNQLKLRLLDSDRLVSVLRRLRGDR